MTAGTRSTSGLLRWHPSRSALIAEAIALPLLGLIAVASAGSASWDIPLLALLLAFAIASDLTAATVSQQGIKISGSFLSIVVAIVLLGGCPAALIGVVTILIGWLRWREASHRLLANAIFYAAFPLLSGALFEATRDLLGATPTDSVFYLLVFGTFAFALALDFLMVAGYLWHLGGASIRESARELLVPLLPSHLSAALLAVGVAYLYHRLGLAAIPLIGIVLLTFQYLMNELLRSEQRAAALERQSEELRSSRQSLAAFVSAAPCVLWAVDRNGRFLMLEGERQGELGLGSARVGATSLFDLGAEVSELVEGTRRALEGGATARIVEAGGLTFDAHFSPLRDGSPQLAGVIGVATDITARVEAQREAEDLADRLGRAQRLESVGQLAGGIAHDFNNLLAVILAYSTLTLDELDEGLRARAHVEEIRRAADRAAHLTRDLLLFSRRQPAESKPIDLNQTVVETMRMLGRTLGSRVEVRTALDPAPRAIAGDQGQLEQVLMNLALNARDAMPAGGRLTFTTQNCVLSEREAARLGGPPAGDYVRLTVADTGTGMTEDVRARIFDPFFTTKELGQGTGLGLATVYGIVGRSGGHIAVSSALGEGTAFEIHWPALDERERPQREGIRPPAGSGETVLIAEDEDGVRKSTGLILERDGYRVIEAPGGHDALGELARTDSSVDLLLTDVVMPDMSGHELARRARSLHPALRVLLMSSYGHEVADPESALGDADPLQKPFAAEALLARIRTALTSERASASSPSDRARRGNACL